ncbi:PepSY domain-containing protein [Methylomicrobium sp. Wu6]|uniref:PepSY domain-containing protein n=1 Tax=Methylomicrobium sp. Wu6 TaxID=3107928 RepID=UPI002DD66A78|nr:PepSY domain-containing protein [Methylomicrobium sp. Wu6]MEC4747991.1 PepSY domain-containing protein [Methylomicrobium sp. Wu6]
MWWPLTGKWRQVLTVKLKARANRLVIDRHKTSGIYSALVVLPVLFSGIYITKPKYLVPVIELYSPAVYRLLLSVQPEGRGPSLKMADAVAIVYRLFPGGRTHLV